jgi:transcriptional regulator with XRE-family HTH domain
MSRRAPHSNPLETPFWSSRKLIGKMIKARREEKHVTQSQLANSLLIDRQYVWRVENGEINLTMDYLDKFIHALKSSHKDFFII